MATLTNPFFSFQPSAEQVEAANTVFKCMAFVQTVQPIVEGYQRKALDDIGRGDMAVRDAWQLPDHVWADYHARCQVYREEAGLKVDHPDHCPLLVAKHLLCQAERVLTDVMEPVAGISFDRIFGAPNALENYKKLVDFNLRLLAPWCKNTLKEA